MGQHISRKELKTDEVRETFAQGAEVVLSHQKLTIYLLAAAIVLALGVFGWRTYSERQTVKASAALNDGMKVFMARVRTPGEPADAGEVTYVDEKNKFTDASQKFGSIAMKYPRTRPGQIAAFYAALSLEKIGKDEDARKWLQGLSESNSDDLAAKARFELAQFDDRAGRSDEAEKIYQQLMAKPAPLVPKPVVMMALAEHYATKNPAEAAKLFAQIKTDYPDTPMAEQADQELALLPGKI